MTTKLAAENTAPLAGLRVLVVEDDYFIADEICTTLRNRGTPSIFATGYDPSVLPGAFSDSVRLEKPVNLNELLRAVQTVCGTADTRNTGTEH